MDLEAIANRLNEMVESLPRFNGSYSLKELKATFYEYQKHLNTINQSGIPFLEGNTRMYYTEISGIQNDIHNAEHGRSQKAKDQSFQDAKRGLDCDMSALRDLIRHHDRPSQTPNPTPGDSSPSSEQ